MSFGGTLFDPLCLVRSVFSPLSGQGKATVTASQVAEMGLLVVKRKRESPGKMGTDGHCQICRGVFGNFGDTVLPGILLRGRPV